MKVGQTGDLTCHGTGTLLTMDLTGILWVSTQPRQMLSYVVIRQLTSGEWGGNEKGND